MEKAKIVEALQAALAKGNGSLDDLSDLLKRAQNDIEAAKKAEAEAAERAKTKRGEDVAKIATRLLNSELTDDDMAFIMNVFFEQHNLNPLWTAKGINRLITDCDDKVSEAAKEAKQAVTGLCDFFNSVFGMDLDPDKLNIQVEKDLRPKPKCDCKKTPDNNKKDPDDVINDFLKKFGLA